MDNVSDTLRHKGAFEAGRTSKVKIPRESKLHKRDPAFFMLLFRFKKKSRESSGGPAKKQRSQWRLAFNRIGKGKIRI